MLVFSKLLFHVLMDRGEDGLQPVSRLEALEVVLIFTSPLLHDAQ